ncbi:hypothetical protein [Faecalibaculum rodentium]|uniref:hypothetical protein n=1 Tax=Faecalibaculum rodentium TaxID=1702221 RepID=UPI0032E8AC3F
MAPHGRHWLDLRPNGLCQHNGLYHIFHQYTPAQDLGLHKSWGHYVTRDWKHFADPGLPRLRPGL